MIENINVLIIEDDTYWSDILNAALKKLGYNVVGIADNLESAIKALNVNNFDIAMVDINIDGRKSGIELGKLLGSTYKKPFIYITSETSEVIMKEVAETSPSAFLTKPVNNTSLMISIKNALSTEEDNEEVPIQTLDDTFFVKLGNSYKKLSWADVICLSVNQNYTQVITPTSGNTFLIRSPLQKTLTNVVPRHWQKDFLRINRAEVINTKYIEELSGNTLVTRHGSFDVTDTHLPEIKKHLHLIL